MTERHNRKKRARQSSAVALVVRNQSRRSHMCSRSIHFFGQSKSKDYFSLHPQPVNPLKHTLATTAAANTVCNLSTSLT
jgi:hypothetical protein